MELKWTKAKPRKKGFYWTRCVVGGASSDKYWHPFVVFFRGGRVLFKGEWKPLEDFNGHPDHKTQRAGPIPEPAE